MIELFIVEIVQELKNTLGTELQYARDLLDSVIVSITFQAKSLHEIEFLIGLSWLASYPTLFVCFFSVRWTLFHYNDNWCYCMLYFFRFFHSRNMTLLYLWPLNRKSISAEFDDENWIQLKMKKHPEGRSMRRIFCFVYSFNLQYDQLIEAIQLSLENVRPLIFCRCQFVSRFVFNWDFDSIMCRLNP